MSHGLSFKFNYAWSKSLDTGSGAGYLEGIDVWQNAYDIGSNYGPSNFDAPFTLTGSFTYEIPVGVNWPFQVHGPLDAVVGGWRITGVMQLHSGNPFTPTIATAVADGIDPANTNAWGTIRYALFPNRVGSGKLSNPTTSAWFDTSAFTDPLPNTFGNSGRDILRGPNYRDLDLSLGKEFRIPFREGMKLEIRADSTDVFNHPYFANPDAVLDAGGIELLMELPQNARKIPI